MKKILVLQPSAHTDHLTQDGVELQQLPYPFFVKEDGTATVGSQTLRVVGFQRDLARHQIDVHFKAVWADPQLAVGLYLVTDDGKTWSVHINAISTATLDEF